MSRDIHAATAAEMQGRSLAPIALLALEFGSGVLRLWSGVGPLQWDGFTWTGSGSLGTISSIEETTELRAVSVSMQLTGVPSDVLEIANGEDWQGRAVTIWLSTLSDANVIIGEPLQIFSGVMDLMTMEEGKNATVTVTAESQLIDLERANSRRYTSEDQRAEYPGDKGCDAVAALQEAQIIWGQ